MSDLEADSWQLIQRLLRHGRETPHRVAFADAAGESIDYAALYHAVRRLTLKIAGEFRERDIHAARPVVLLRCRNRVAFPVWFLALIASGIDVLAVSDHLAAAELEHILERTGAAAIVDDRRDGATNLDGGACCLPLNWAMDLDINVRTDSMDAGRFSAVSPGSLLLCSSGTTGRPRIVRRSSHSLDSVSQAMVGAIGFRPNDVVLAAVPLSHSYGIEHGLLAPIWAGSSVRLCDGLDLPVIAPALSGATIFPAVPSMIEMLAQVADSELQAKNLRCAYSAGGPLPPAVAVRFFKRFGIHVGQVYGMTEIGSVTYADATNGAPPPGCVGMPMRGVRIRIAAADGAPAAPGEEGEVAVSAGSMLDGYLGEAADFVNGYFPTADLGRIDPSGRLYITGRARLLIDSGGLKVNPAEIEAIIAQHAAVRECAVVAVRQSDTVQRIRAVVVAQSGVAGATADEIRRWTRLHLAAHKVPRIVEFVEALPRTAAGKVDRRALEAQ